MSIGIACYPLSVGSKSKVSPAISFQSINYNSISGLISLAATFQISSISITYLEAATPMYGPWSMRYEINRYDVQILLYSYLPRHEDRSRCVWPIPSLSPVP